MDMNLGSSRRPGGPARWAGVLLAGLLASSLGQACELCRAAYFQALEDAPRASALHPGAKVVEYSLEIGKHLASPAGQPVQVLTVNGSSPGPVLRFREGDVARITVRNSLPDEETSIHWHGMLVPNLEDGVPLLTTPVIGPGGSRTFEFLIRQHGTYWYHSHTAHQEQRGVHGGIVIEPRAAPAAPRADHDEVIVLGDWTDESALEVQRTLHRGDDWYAIRKG
jgi:FtsP/CotA-like multicopper oxidase with cupredoxin domain